MKLLVAYIATSGGADAVALGSSLARTLDAELELCVVIPPDPHATGADEQSDIDKLSDALDHAAQAWLDDAAAMIPDDIETTATIATDANPALGLIRQAQKSGADVIVMGGSGGGILGRHTLGSVVNGMLHSSPIPVALAPLGFSHVGAEKVRELTVMIGHRPGTDLLFQTAIRAGLRAHRPIRMVSLVALDEVQPWADTPDELAVSDARKHAQSTLDEALRRLPTDFPISSTIAQGHTIEEAVSSLEWHDGDVIVVGSSRLAAPNTIFLGSTASKILRALSIPMIVVPGTDADTPADLNPDH